MAEHGGGSSDPSSSSGGGGLPPLTGGAHVTFHGPEADAASGKVYKPPMRRPAPPSSSSSGGQQQQPHPMVGDVGGGSGGTPPLSLQHFSFNCPGLTGPGARTDIRKRVFGDVLSSPEPLIIPLFQRKYCWEAHHAEQWFSDTVKPAAWAMCGDQHGVGKVIFKQRDGSLWCIDGQQRMTTMSLQLAAIRDACLHYLHRPEDSLFRPLSVSDSRELNATIDRIHAHLCLDPAGFEAWIRDHAKSLRRRAAGERVGGGADDASSSEKAASVTSVGKYRDNVTTIAELWEEDIERRAANYERLPHTRLVPSLSDRRPFGELLATGMLRAALGEFGGDEQHRPRPASGVNPLLSPNRGGGAADDDDAAGKDGDGDDDPLEEDALWPLPTTLETSRSHMGVIKAVLDRRVRQHVRSQLAAAAAASSTDGDAQEEQKQHPAVTALANLVERSLNNMHLIYVDVLSDVDLSMVFLWMQEKTLFGFGALLYNPSPGKDFRAADLARNLFLAPHMEEEAEVQEARYRELWLEAFERRCPLSKKAGASMEHCIKVLLERVTGQKYSEMGSTETGAAAAAAAAGGSSAPVASTSSSWRSVGNIVEAAKNGVTTVSRRHVSSYEKQADSLIQRFGEADVKKHDYSGVRAYTRLYSLYEARCAAWRHEHADDDDASPSSWGEPSREAEAAVALEVLAGLAYVAEDIYSGSDGDAAAAAFDR